MTYVVTKMIKGNPYLYEVRSEREGDRVRQIFVRYLGRADRAGTIERRTTVSRTKKVKPEKVTPIITLEKPVGESTSIPEVVETTEITPGIKEEQAMTNWQQSQVEANRLIKDIESEWVTKTHTGVTQEQQERIDNVIKETAQKYKVPEGILRKNVLWEARVEPEARPARLAENEIDELISSVSVKPKPEVEPTAVAPPVEPKEEAITTEKPVEAEVKPEPEIISTPEAPTDYIIKQDLEPTPVEIRGFIEDKTVNDKLSILSEEQRKLIKGFRVNPNLRGANAAWNNTYKTIDVSSLSAAKKLKSSTINHEVRHAILDDLITNNRNVVDEFARKNGQEIDWTELERLSTSYKDRPNTIVEAFNIKYAKLSEDFAKAEVLKDYPELAPKPETPSS